MAAVASGMLPARSRCRTCQASIYWARTASGRRIPLDLEPREDGNVVVEDEDCIVLGKEARELEQNAGTALYVSHFVTCPHASIHRGV